MKLKKGATRFVILIGNYAVKFPAIWIKSSFYGTFYMFLQGWLGNRNEYLWSRSRIFDYLCRVRISVFLSFIIIMDKAEELTQEEFATLKEKDYEFKKIEWKKSSFGKINGEIKIIDYG